jgi:UDP-N-acetylglucosamine 2-epimerase (non-hydrolysing)
VLAGTARLVGLSRERIVSECVRLLDDREAYESMSRAHNPYGDGRASERIGKAIHQFLHVRSAAPVRSLTARRCS